MKYPRAPIVEAIVELRFRDPIDEKSVERASDKMAKRYPQKEDQLSFSLEFNAATNEQRQVIQWRGTKRTTLDLVDGNRISNIAFTSIRLAPYREWESFFERTKQDWMDVSGVLGKRIVNRVGVRFINRIDIPGQAKTLKAADFVTLRPTSIDLDWAPMDAYLIQMSRRLSNPAWGVMINSGPVESPLISHESILLDIDVYADNLQLAKDSDLWEHLAALRVEKNRIFEACITDNARKLFE